MREMDPELVGPAGLGEEADGRREIVQVADRFVAGRGWDAAFAYLEEASPPGALYDGSVDPPGPSQPPRHHR